MVIDTFDREVPMYSTCDSLSISEIDSILWDRVGNACSSMVDAEVSAGRAHWPLVNNGCEHCPTSDDSWLDLGVDRVGLPFEVTLKLDVNAVEGLSAFKLIMADEAVFDIYPHGTEVELAHLSAAGGSLALSIHDPRFDPADAVSGDGLVVGYQTGADFRLRMRVEETGTLAKVWFEGDPEPMAWQARHEGSATERPYRWLGVSVGSNGHNPTTAGDLYLDDVEIVTGYTPTLACDEETFTQVGPRAGDVIPISLRYDPRIVMDQRLDGANDMALAMLDQLRDRADTALTRYEQLGFDLPQEITIELDCDPDFAGFHPNDPPNDPPRDAMVGDSGLIQIRAEYVRDQLAVAALADFLGEGPWDEVGADWRNLVDHEAFHTVQRQVSLAPDVIKGMQTLIESTATLGQDLQTDSDDVQTPASTRSYLDGVAAFHVEKPTVDVRSNRPEAYMSASVLQYWGERFGPQDESNLEQRVSRFLKVLIEAPGLLDFSQAASMADALGHDYATGEGQSRDVAYALRDYLIAAYALRASNVSTTQNEAYAILDAGELAGDYRELVPDGSLDLTVDGTASTPEALDLLPYEGEVFEIALPPATVAVKLTVDRHYFQIPFTSGPDLRAAALPMGADDSIVIHDGLMFDIGAGARTVAVNGRNRLALVLAAGANGVNYTVSAEALVGDVAMSFSHPTAGNPHCTRSQRVIVDFALTVDGVPVEGETGAGFGLTVGGEDADVSSVWPIPGGYRLGAWAASTLAVGTHAVTLTYAGETFAVPGGLRHDPACGPRHEQVEVAYVPSLADGATATADATISAGAAEAVFAAEWLGSDVDLTLTAPSGRVITESSSAVDVTISHTADEVTITVTTPEAGVWDIELFGDDLPQPEPVDVIVTEADAPLSAEATLTVGATAGLPIDAVLSLGASDALAVESVAATLTDPVGVMRTFELHDDGGHRDAGADDGVYGARLFATSLAGAYRVELRATGTDAEGEPFTRVHVEEVTLAAVVDADADGVADGAEPDLGLNPADGDDGGLDPDADGLDIAAELAAGTDPFTTDSDAGGERDGSEVAAERDPLSAADDTALPGVALTAGAGDGREVALEAHTADDGTQIRLYRGDDEDWTLLGTYAGPSVSITDGPLAVGEYRYAASALATNGAESARNVIGPLAVAEDVTPPEVRLIANGGRWESGDTTARLRFIDLSEPVTDTRVALTQADLASAVWQPFTATAEIEIPAVLGLHTVYAQVRDAAGHESRVVQAPILFIDDRAPISQASADLEYDIASVEIAYYAWDPDDLSVIINVELWWRQRPDEQGAWSSWTLGPEVSSPDDPLVFDFPAGPGEYEFYTIATDAADNREPPPESAESSTTAVTPVERTTLRASLASAGEEANGSSDAPALSTDGRYVAFSSMATNLVAGDTNGVADVFVRDTQTGTTSRVSVDSAGTQATGASSELDASGDGRYVAFSSAASNLVAGDTNGVPDIFLHDRQSGATTRVSLASGGGQADGASDQPAISADASSIAFRSSATNLVTGDTNSTADIFVYDGATGTPTRVSIDGTGVQANGASTAPVLSADGSAVAFDSAATNLVADDTNSERDVFVRDRATGGTSRVSVAWDGTQADAASTDPAISADGRFVVFVSAAGTFDGSDANGLTNIYVHHRDWLDTWRVSRDMADGDPDGASTSPSVSADGRFVAFTSSATDLVADDANGEPDVFVRDLHRARTSRWSLTSDDAESSGSVAAMRMSSDGSMVAFVSDGSDLVSGDTNAVADLFLRVPE